MEPAAGLISDFNTGTGASNEMGGVAVARAVGEEDTRGDERRKFPLCLESRCISVQAEGTTDYSKMISNHKDFSLSEDDVDNKEMDEFGTTV